MSRTNTHDIHVAICKCLQRGPKVTLQSGTQTDVYLDLRQLFSQPDIMARIGSELASIIDPTTYDSVAGCPYGAIPYAVLVAQLTGKTFVVVRKEPKLHGMPSSQKRRILLIEDVMTTGQSLQRFKTFLESEGHSVTAMCAIVNRGASQSISSLFSFQDILHPPPHIRRALLEHPLAQQIWDRMQSHQTNVCLAADVHTTTELMDLLRQVEPYICMVKIHSDIILDWTPEFGRELKTWAKERGLVIMEDRKLADIGLIARRQATLRISHADCVTSHMVAGKNRLG